MCDVFSADRSSAVPDQQLRWQAGTRQHRPACVVQSISQRTHSDLLAISRPLQYNVSYKPQNGDLKAITFGLLCLPGFACFR